MEAREQKLKRVTQWAYQNDDVRAMLLTSSLVNPLAPVDDLSDLDIELVFADNATYILDRSWINHFGNAIAMIEEDENSFDGKHAMKMVIFDDYVKIDFKLYSKPNFLKEVQQKELPGDWDIGYKVLVDKDGLTKQLKPPTHQVSIIKKPTEQKFKQLLNDFWWDTTYVAKCLARNDIFYAKFASENIIRTDYFVPLIEWYIASKHNWSVTTNKHGRLFKKYLTPELWKKIEATFSGAEIAANWSALFATADVVHSIATYLAGSLNYPYPHQLERDIRGYLSHLKNKCTI